MTSWAKVHTDMIGDKKLLRAARKGARHLHLLPWLIVFAKLANDEGRLTVHGAPADLEDLAEGVPCVTPDDMAACLAELAAPEVEVVTRDEDGAWRLTSWEQRQAKPSASPTRVKDRVTKHRAKKKAEKRAKANADADAGSGADSDSPKQNPAPETPVTPPVTRSGNAACNADGNAIEGEVEGEEDLTTTATTDRPPAADPRDAGVVGSSENDTPPPAEVPLVRLLADDWRELMGGVPSADRIGKACRAVRNDYPDASAVQIRLAWRRYLAAHVEAKREVFANPQDWASRYLPWSRGNPLDATRRPPPRAASPMQTEGTRKLERILAAGRAAPREDDADAPVPDGAEVTHGA